jgi:hypothetical protein
MTITPHMETVLAKIDAAFNQPPVDKTEALHKAIAFWSQDIRRIRAQIEAHTEWRATMNAKNPGSLVFFSDDRPALQRQIDRLSALITAAESKLAEGVS